SAALARPIAVSPMSGEFSMQPARVSRSEHRKSSRELPAFRGEVNLHSGMSSPVGRLARLLPWFACKAGQQRLPNALMRLVRIERDSQCQKRRDITCEDSIFQFPCKVGLEFRAGNLPA